MAVHYRKDSFPPVNMDYAPLIPLLGPTTAAVARYDATLAMLQNPALLLSPLTTREAVLSSRIEGTQATLSEVMEYEADGGQTPVDEHRRNDIVEVLNYRKAMYEAERQLATLPLTGRVILNAHRVLMEGARGQNRAPGEYRRTPNWIGPEGCDINGARFVPISAADIPVAIGTWERYVHSSEPADRLIQASVIHAEFEAIHPFLDGNGRLGRMLVPLFLWQKEVISRPMFYISAAIEARREEYYERLLAVSRDGDWTGWCVFFLGIIKAQAEENQAKAGAIFRLHQEMVHKVAEITRSQYAPRACQAIFSNPFFSINEFITTSQIPPPAGRKITMALRNHGIIRELRKGGGRRSALFVFPELVNMAEGKAVV